MTIETRLRKLEDKLSMKREPLPPPILILHHPRAYGETDLPQFPEPEEQWQTCRDAFEESRRSGMPLVVEPDPVAEYEARHGLEPGALSEHPQYGKVPFRQLLELVTAATG